MHSGLDFAGPIMVLVIFPNIVGDAGAFVLYVIMDALLGWLWSLLLVAFVLWLVVQSAWFQYWAAFGVGLGFSDTRCCST